jgi:plastocyanin domain-containing protein
MRKTLQQLRWCLLLIATLWGIPLNEPVVVSFTPKRKGSFTFVCGMNMMRGELIVR